MREHRDSLPKPKVCLTFDVERDYVKSGYLDPRSFEGITHYVPRILDKLGELGGTGTFFLTPEVIENCEDLVGEIRKKHAIGLHSHAYYQPEFKGWNANGDSFDTYSLGEVRQMITRDVDLYERTTGSPKLFRIGRLEPNHTVLKTISELGCLYDSSYHADDYSLIRRLRAAISYRFREIPVTAHLFGLEPRHFKLGRPVVLIHPITPPGMIDREVYDEEHLFRILDVSAESYEFKGLDDLG